MKETFASPTVNWREAEAIQGSHRAVAQMKIMAEEYGRAHRGYDFTYTLEIAGMTTRGVREESTNANEMEMDVQQKVVKVENKSEESIKIKRKRGARGSAALAKHDNRRTVEKKRRSIQF
jgi:hypothetical protein